MMFDKKTKPEEKKEEQKEDTLDEDEYPICVKCGFHRKEGPYQHNCYSSKNINFITGELEPDDCEDINSEGDCPDFKKKV